MSFTTSPGFSSRSSVHVTRQFPQRDEAMNEHEAKLEAGWSNSEPADDAPQDVTPDVQTPDEVEPGFSNAKAVKSDEPEPEQAPEPEPDKPAAKKTAAKKKG